MTFQKISEESSKVPSLSPLLRACAIPSSNIGIARSCSPWMSATVPNQTGRLTLGQVTCAYDRGNAGVRQSFFGVGEDS